MAKERVNRRLTAILAADVVGYYRITGTLRVAIPASKTATDRPSIAVLPFTNMSGDPEQGYCSDGISEDILTEMSRLLPETHPLSRRGC